jgi:uncharacterized protein (TIGR02145 family)
MKIRFVVFIFSIIIINFYSCKDEESVLIPVLSTASVSDITEISAVSGGNISDDGGLEIIDRGVCWGTTSNPTIAMNKTVDGDGTGSFTSNITGLTQNTVYHVRAYATNSEGTGYGSDVSFTTIHNPQAMITTVQISSITPATAISGGNVLSAGDGAIISKGVCWSKFQNPTVTDNITSDGSGTGIFKSYLTGLEPETQYYVRAYASNDFGISYGQEVTFRTSGVIALPVFNPDLVYDSIYDSEGNKYRTIDIGTQTWMAENLKSTKLIDGTDIPFVPDVTLWSGLTTPGYCWFNNDSVGYGALYNWYTVNTGKLCPEGWHVPTDEEWTLLTDYLGGKSVAGGKLREAGTSHWQSPNTGATNETGFTGLPAGYRSSSGGFNSFRNYGFWWTSTDWSTTGAWYRDVYYGYNSVDRSNSNKKSGANIRCLKD